jgi:hypothetical protein
MNTIKHFQRFLESEDKGVELSYEIRKSKNWNYDSEDDSFNFEYHGDEENPYLLKVFPKFEIFHVTFPDKSSQWCSFNALKQRSDFFKQFEIGVFYIWLLRVIMQVEYSVNTGTISWNTLDEPLTGNQDH